MATHINEIRLLGEPNNPNAQHPLKGKRKVLI